MLNTYYDKVLRQSYLCKSCKHLSWKNAKINSKIYSSMHNARTKFGKISELFFGIDAILTTVNMQDSNKVCVY